MTTEFWKSAGLPLVEENDAGWLSVTPDYLRAYLSRPEIHPVDESCDTEHRLFEALMADPFRSVDDDQISEIKDDDAADNYRLLLTFRDYLTTAGTIEGAYLEIIGRDRINVPPLFLDQMVHLILRHVLKDCRDPLRLRAAEMFFREQKVSTDNGSLMLADQEIVEMKRQADKTSGPGQLIAELTKAGKTIELDVLTDRNSNIYWDRSDRFDTVIDLRFGFPAIDAFARVVEAWLAHLLKLGVRVQPQSSISDERWRWHIGLDIQATKLLNDLYRGRDLPPEELALLIALFEMKIKDDSVVTDDMRGREIYLAVAMTPEKLVRIKPQNLLTNLPLKPSS